MNLKKVLFGFLKKHLKKKSKNSILIYQDESPKSNETNLDETSFKDTGFYEKNKKEFEQIEPMMVIVAKTPGYNSKDLSHLYRPFIVVGRNCNTLYAIMETTSSKYKDDNRYYKYHNDKKDIIAYCQCDKLYQINKDDFKYFSYHMPIKNYEELIKKLNKYCKTLDKVDYDLFSYPLKVGSVLLNDNNDLYVVLKTDKKEIIITKLLLNDKSKRYIYMMGRKYAIDADNIIRVSKDDDNYKVIDFIDPKLNRLRNIDLSGYELGDVLLLEKSSKKIIFLTQIADVIFYADLDALDFFNGIGKINKDKVSGFYRKLSDNEIEMLVKKIERPLNDEKNVIYYGAKENILRSINKIKK